MTTVHKIPLTAFQALRRHSPCGSDYIVNLQNPNSVELISRVGSGNIISIFRLIGNVSTLPITRYTGWFRPDVRFGIQCIFAWFHHPRRTRNFHSLSRLCFPPFFSFISRKLQSFVSVPVHLWLARTSHYESPCTWWLEGKLHSTSFPNESNEMTLAQNRCTLARLNGHNQMNGISESVSVSYCCCQEYVIIAGSYK